jgi:hypothetical protein
LKTERPSIRFSVALQALVAQAGGTSPALRALIILGAAAAGEDVRPLHGEILRLRGDEQIAPHIRAALAGLSDERPPFVGRRSDAVEHAPAEMSHSPAADPFGELAVEI